MASINVGMPETDPVLLHAREHLRAQQNGAVNAVRRRFVCFVPGCPVQCTKTEDLKRHFNRGWHSDANAGAPADWDADQVFTVPEADWLADLGLTATKAATDAASFAATRLTAPAYTADDLADKAKASFPRDPTWQPRVAAWKVAKGYKTAAPGSAAAPVPAPVSVSTVALPAGGVAAVAAAAPAAAVGPAAPVPAAPTLFSAGPADTGTSNTSDTNAKTYTGRARVGAGEAAARAESKRKLAALVAAPPPRPFRRLATRNGPRWFGLGPARLGGGDDEDNEDGE